MNPSGEVVTVSRIVTFGGDLAEAHAGDAVTLVFDRQVDAARGDILSDPAHRLVSGKSYAATVVSLQGEGIADGASVWIRTAGRQRRVVVSVDQIYDLSQGVWLQAGTLPINAIGRIRLHFQDEMIFDRFDECRDTGSFILVSPLTNNTIAGGMIRELASEARTAADTVTLSLPKDLADWVLSQPEVIGRLGEIEVLSRG